MIKGLFFFSYQPELMHPALDRPFHRYRLWTNPYYPGILCGRNPSLFQGAMCFRSSLGIRILLSVVSCEPSDELHDTLSRVTALEIVIAMALNSYITFHHIHNEGLASCPTENDGEPPASTESSNSMCSTVKHRLPA